MLDKPIHDNVYVHRVLARDHVATNFPVRYRFQTSENTEGTSVELSSGKKGSYPTKGGFLLTVGQLMPA